MRSYHLTAYLLLMLAGLYQRSALAQFYPDPLANWCLSCNVSPAGGTSVMHMLSDPDTVINDITYKSVEHVHLFDAGCGPNIPRFHIRSTGNGIGYIYIPTLSQEFKTGDVSATVGDTVRDVLVWDQTNTCAVVVETNVGLALVDVVVLGIDTITSQGVTVVRHSVWPLCPGTFTPTFWQAGIGTEHGPLLLLTPGLAHITLDRASVGDTCYYDPFPFFQGLPGGPNCCVFTDPNGIADLPSGHDLLIRPNPSSGLFTVEFPVPLRAGSYYSVYDPTGRLLYQRPLPTGATREEVDLSRFGPGTYVLRVTDREGQRHERVVIE